MKNDCMYCGGDHSSLGCPSRDEEQLETSKQVIQLVVDRLFDVPEGSPMGLCEG